MTCTHCTKPALTVVADKGFCGNHRAEAIAAMKALGDRKLGRDKTVNAFIERRRA